VHGFAIAAVGQALAVAFLLACSTPATEAGPERVAKSSKVLWKADGESSLASEWASSSSLPAAAAPASPDASRIAKSRFRAQGRRSYCFEVRDGDESYGERAELGQALPARPGDEYHDGAMDPAHLRVGIYRDPAIQTTARLNVDGITVAKTRAAAESNAYRSR